MRLASSRHNYAVTKTRIVATAADEIKSQLLSTPVADDTNRRVVVAQVATLATYTHTAVLLTSGGSDIVVLKATNEHAGQTTVQVARGLVETSPKK